MSLPYLIVGLGNPGRAYEGTRHNAGFDLVDFLARDWQASWGDEKKLKARLAKADPQERKVLLCQPQTFMNRSGEAVRRVVDFYQVPLAQALVVVDDADLPLGAIRLRMDGSSGGHRGLESIEAHLKTRDFARLRLGIGRRSGEGGDMTGHVLGRFSSEEAGWLEKVLRQAARQVECWLVEGLQKAMSKYNGSIETRDEIK